MGSTTCPKCGGNMDQGRVGVGEEIRYTSDRQTGPLRTPTPVRRARVCALCGYVELYLDASELQKKLGA